MNGSVDGAQRRGGAGGTFARTVRGLAWTGAGRAVEDRNQHDQAAPGRGRHNVPRRDLQSVLVQPITPVKVVLPDPGALLAATFQLDLVCPSYTWHTLLYLARA